MESVSCVISGAKGWLGKEAAKILFGLGVKLHDLQLITSKPDEMKLGDKIIKTRSFSIMHKKLSPELYFDFAFIGKSQIGFLGKSEYIKKNHEIIQSSANLISELRPKSVILTSSGAVYHADQADNMGNEIVYSRLKIEQEKIITDACHNSGSNLTIVRVFNLSGSGIYSRREYALFEFIENALSNKTIVIASDFRVYRRYCDIEQLIKLLIKLGLNKSNKIFDSGGVKIELRELAERIKLMTESKSKILSKEIDINKLDDLYFSNSTEYESLVLHNLNETPNNLGKQLSKTINEIHLDKLKF
jgi:nucleoside-diphosphate-sugar epimerase